MKTLWEVTFASSVAFLVEHARSEAHAIEQAREFVENEEIELPVEDDDDEWSGDRVKFIGGVLGCGPDYT